MPGLVPGGTPISAAEFYSAGDPGSPAGSGPAIRPGQVLALDLQEMRVPRLVEAALGHDLGLAVVLVVGQSLHLIQQHFGIAGQD